MTKEHNENSLVPVSIKEIDKATQSFLANANELPLNRLMMASRDKQVQLAVYSHALEQVVSLRQQGVLSEKKFNDRMSALFRLDTEKDSTDERSYSLTKETVNTWTESDDPDLQAFGEGFWSFISVSQMEDRFDRLDKDTCSPSRMAIYIKNAAFKVNIALKRVNNTKTKNVNPNPNSTTEASSPISTDLEALVKDLDEILSVATDREDSGENGFLDDVVEKLRKSNLLPKYRDEYTSSPLLYCLDWMAKDGSEGAAEFLEYAFLDLDYDASESDYY